MYNCSGLDMCRYVKKPQTDYFLHSQQKSLSQNVYFYLLSWEKSQNADPAGIGMVLLRPGDSEARRRVLSTSSSSGSNWPSSSSAKSEAVFNADLLVQLPIFGREDKERALFGHGFRLFCTID
jgi:hypothetical protein